MGQGYNQPALIEGVPYTDEHGNHATYRCDLAVRVDADDNNAERRFFEFIGMVLRAGRFLITYSNSL